MREAGPRARSGGVPHDLQPYLEPLEADTAGTPQSVNEDLLEMGNLLMMQFYHLHTAKKMSADQKRARVWQRVIPHLAGRNRYLMHLLLALGGIHMITERLRHRTAEESDLSETVDLRAVMRHHQKGLEDFREDVAQISNSNAEAVYAGSLLLAGFIFASLQVPELNPNVTTANSVSVPHGPTLNRQFPQTSDRLQLSWLHLIRGVSSVIQDQWSTLKASCLRPMALHFHGDEYWKYLPFASSLSRLSHCSPRLLVFVQGASQAIADLRTSWAATWLVSNNGSDLIDSPTSLPSSTSDGAVDEQSRTIDILEKFYSRIIEAVQCSINEHIFPDESDIQANFEEATVVSWPSLISSDFISLLETHDQVDLIWGHSWAILAHFYVINTLIDRWYLKGSFEGEILKICDSVCSSFNAQLGQLTMWLVKIVTS